MMRASNRFQNWFEAGGSVFFPRLFCSDDWYSSVAAGQTWTALPRGACLVGHIGATLIFPDGNLRKCDPYTSIVRCIWSIPLIIMKGDDASCVQSSHESQVCPCIKRWNLKSWCDGELVPYWWDAMWCKSMYNYICETMMMRIVIPEDPKDKILNQKLKYIIVS